MSRAIIWCRVSTTAQEFESQKKELIEAALKDGFNKKDLIVIGEAGASAIKMNDLYQKEVNQLLEAIDHTDSVDTIYVWEVSRLARNEVAFYQMKDKIIKNKIQLKCNVPQIKLLDDNGEVNNGMEITLNLLVTLAKQEMEIKKKRFARGKQQKATEGKYNGGAIPFGYKVDADRDNSIVIDEEKAKLVKLIFDLYENGYSQPKLVNELRARGFLTVTLSLVNHVLSNESYTGIKRKTKNASYERQYAPIITPQQYIRCRQLAKQNNVNLTKSKNIYYAEHLVKCQNCGAYWSASGHKATYACYNSTKPKTTWQRENHSQEKCINKTTISINILDSILWYIAKRYEAEYIINADDTKKKEYEAEYETVMTKLSNITQRLDNIKVKLERLRLMYVDGLREETYNSKRAELKREEQLIKTEELGYKNELQHIQKLIDDFQSKVYMKITTSTDGFIYETNKPEFRYNILLSLNKIKDDNERKKIIQRNVKAVEVIPTVIRYPFCGGLKDAKAKKITVYGYNGQIHVFFTLPTNGKGCPIILNSTPDVFSSDLGTFYSYSDDVNYPLDDIAQNCFELRYEDTPKKLKRDQNREIAKQRIGNRVSINQATKETGIKYWKLYKMVRTGKIQFEMINGKYYIDPNLLSEVN